MKLLEKIIIRPVALTISLLMLLETVAWANGVNVFSLQVNKNYGSITQRYKGTSDKTVIVVQDAHQNYEAQKNIAGIIQDLVEKNEVPVVAVEGASGKLSTDEFSSFPDQLIKEKVVDDFLKRGKISASEYASLVGQKKFSYVGVEDADLYQKNYKALQESKVLIDRALPVLDECRTLIQSLVETVVGERLKQVLRDYQNCQDPSQFEQRLLWIERTAAAEGIDLSNYVSLYSFLEMAAKSGENSSVRESSTVDIARIMHDMCRVEYELLQKSAQTILEKDIADYCWMIDKVYDMLMLSVSYEEYMMYSERKLSQAVARISSISSRATEITGNVYPEIAHLDVVDDAIKHAEVFYTYAEKRNTSLAAHTLNALKNDAEHAAVLVVGGYHTAGITAYLQSKGISYAVVTPTVSEIRGERHQADRIESPLGTFEQFLITATHTIPEALKMAVSDSLGPLDANAEKQQAIKLSMLIAYLKEVLNREVSNIPQDANHETYRQQLVRQSATLEREWDKSALARLESNNVSLENILRYTKHGTEDAVKQEQFYYLFTINDGKKYVIIPGKYSVNAENDLARITLDLNELLLSSGIQVFENEAYVVDRAKLYELLSRLEQEGSLDALLKPLYYGEKSEPTHIIGYVPFFNTILTDDAEKEKKIVSRETQAPTETTLTPSSLSWGKYVGMIVLVVSLSLQVLFSFVHSALAKAPHATKSVSSEIVQSDTMDEYEDSVRYESFGYRHHLHVPYTLLNHDSDYMKTIVLDPGHGGTYVYGLEKGKPNGDPGNLGKNGTREADITLDIAHRVEGKLKVRGINVKLTRNADIPLPLDARSKFANSIDGGATFVSIHLNASPRTDAQGMHAFYYPYQDDNEHNGFSQKEGVFERVNDIYRASGREGVERFQQSKVLGEIFGQQFKEFTSVSGAPSVPTDSRYGDYYVLRNTRYPAVLLELDYLSNQNTEVRYSKEEERDKLADVVTRGIMEYSRYQQWKNAFISEGRGLFAYVKTIVNAPEYGKRANELNEWTNRIDGSYLSRYEDLYIKGGSLSDESVWPEESYPDETILALQTYLNKNFNVSIFEDGAFGKQTYTAYLYAKLLTEMEKEWGGTRFRDMVEKLAQNSGAVSLEDATVLDQFLNTSNVFELLASVLGVESDDAFQVLAKLNEEIKKWALESKRYARQQEKEKTRDMRKTLEKMGPQVVRGVSTFPEKNVSRVSQERQNESRNVLAEIMPLYVDACVAEMAASPFAPQVEWTFPGKTRNDLVPVHNEDISDAFVPWGSSDAPMMISESMYNAFKQMKRDSGLPFKIISGYMTYENILDAQRKKGDRNQEHPSRSMYAGPVIRIDVMPGSSMEYFLKREGKTYGFIPAIPEVDSHYRVFDPTAWQFNPSTILEEMKQHHEEPLKSSFMYEYKARDGKAHHNRWVLTSGKNDAGLSSVSDYIQKLLIHYGTSASPKEQTRIINEIMSYGDYGLLVVLDQRFSLNESQRSLANDPAYLRGLIMVLLQFWEDSSSFIGKLSSEKQKEMYLILDWSIQKYQLQVDKRDESREEMEKRLQSIKESLFADGIAAQKERLRLDQAKYREAEKRSQTVPSALRKQYQGFCDVIHGRTHSTRERDEAFTALFANASPEDMHQLVLLGLPELFVDIQAEYQGSLAPREEWRRSYYWAKYMLKNWDKFSHEDKTEIAYALALFFDGTHQDERRVYLTDSDRTIMKEMMIREGYYEALWDLTDASHMGDLVKTIIAKGSPTEREKLVPYLMQRTDSDALYHALKEYLSLEQHASWSDVHRQNKWRLYYKATEWFLRSYTRLSGHNQQEGFARVKTALKYEAISTADMAYSYANMAITHEMFRQYNPFAGKENGTDWLVYEQEPYEVLKNEAFQALKTYSFANQGTLRLILKRILNLKEVKMASAWKDQAVRERNEELYQSYNHIVEDMLKTLDYRSYPSWAQVSREDAWRWYFMAMEFILSQYEHLTDVQKAHLKALWEKFNMDAAYIESTYLFTESTKNQVRLLVTQSGIADLVYPVKPRLADNNVIWRFDDGPNLKIFECIRTLLGMGFSKDAIRVSVIGENIVNTDYIAYQEIINACKSMPQIKADELWKQLQAAGIIVAKNTQKSTDVSLVRASIVGDAFLFEKSDALSEEQKKFLSRFPQGSSELNAIRRVLKSGHEKMEVTDEAKTVLPYLAHIGLEMAIHSFGHKASFKGVSNEQFINEIIKTQQAINMAMERVHLSRGFVTPGSPLNLTDEQRSIVNNFYRKGHSHSVYSIKGITSLGEIYPGITPEEEKKIQREWVGEIKDHANVDARDTRPRERLTAKALATEIVKALQGGERAIIVLHEHTGEWPEQIKLTAEEFASRVKELQKVKIEPKENPIPIVSDPSVGVGFIGEKSEPGTEKVLLQTSYTPRKDNPWGTSMQEGYYGEMRSLSPSPSVNDGFITKHMRGKNGLDLLVLGIITGIGGVVLSRMMSIRRSVKKISEKIYDSVDMVVRIEKRIADIIEKILEKVLGGHWYTRVKTIEPVNQARRNVLKLMGVGIAAYGVYRLSEIVNTLQYAVLPKITRTWDKKIAFLFPDARFDAEELRQYVLMVVDTHDEAESIVTSIKQHIYGADASIGRINEGTGVKYSVILNRMVSNEDGLENVPYQRLHRNAGMSQEDILESIRKESGQKETLLSSSGAAGYMQLKLETIVDVFKQKVRLDASVTGKGSSRRTLVNARIRELVKRAGGSSRIEAEIAREEKGERGVSLVPLLEEYENTVRTCHDQALLYQYREALLLRSRIERDEKIFALIPDAWITEPFFTESLPLSDEMMEQLHYQGQYQSLMKYVTDEEKTWIAQKGITPKSISRSVALAMRHGPVNVICASVYQAYYRSYIQLLKDIAVLRYKCQDVASAWSQDYATIDPSIEVSLATDMSYNGGWAILNETLRKQGSWAHIFRCDSDVTQCLSGQTADYGWQYLRYRLGKDPRYQIHPDQKTHEHMAYTALLRSVQYFIEARLKELARKSAEIETFLSVNQDVRGDVRVAQEKLKGNIDEEKRVLARVLSAATTVTSREENSVSKEDVLAIAQLIPKGWPMEQQIAQFVKLVNGEGFIKTQKRSFLQSIKRGMLSFVAGSLLCMVMCFPMNGSANERVSSVQPGVKIEQTWSNQYSTLFPDAKQKTINGEVVYVVHTTKSETDARDVAATLQSIFTEAHVESSKVSGDVQHYQVYISKLRDIKSETDLLKAPINLNTTTLDLQDARLTAQMESGYDAALISERGEGGLMQVTLEEIFHISQLKKGVEWRRADSNEKIMNSLIEIKTVTNNVAVRSAAENCQAIIRDESSRNDEVRTLESLHRLLKELSKSKSLSSEHYLHFADLVYEKENRYNNGNALALLPDALFTHPFMTMGVQLGDAGRRILVPHQLNELDSEQKKAWNITSNMVPRYVVMLYRHGLLGVSFWAVAAQCYTNEILRYMHMSQEMEKVLGKEKARTQKGYIDPETNIDLVARLIFNIGPTGLREAIGSDYKRLFEHLSDTGAKYALLRYVGLLKKDASFMLYPHDREINKQMAYQALVRYTVLITRIYSKKVEHATRAQFEASAGWKKFFKTYEAFTEFRDVCTYLRDALTPIADAIKRGNRTINDQQMDMFMKRIMQSHDGEMIDNWKRVIESVKKRHGKELSLVSPYQDTRMMQLSVVLAMGVCVVLMSVGKREGVPVLITRHNITESAPELLCIGRYREISDVKVAWDKLSASGNEVFYKIDTEGYHCLYIYIPESHTDTPMGNELKSINMTYRIYNTAA